MGNNLGAFRVIQSQSSCSDLKPTLDRAEPYCGSYPRIGHTKERCSLCFLTIVMLSFVCIHVLTTFYHSMCHTYIHTYIHIGSISKANPFRDIFNEGIFHGIPKETSVFIIGKVTLSRSHRGPGMVGEYTKSGGKLPDGWICVFTAGRGAREFRAK